jgi:hypothetical protein
MLSSALLGGLWIAKFVVWRGFFLRFLRFRLYGPILSLFGDKTFTPEPLLRARISTPPGKFQLQSNVAFLVDFLKSHIKRALLEVRPKLYSLNFLGPNGTGRRITPTCRGSHFSKSCRIIPRSVCGSLEKLSRIPCSSTVVTESWEAESGEVFLLEPFVIL